VVACLKAAVTGGTSTTSGWASEIAYAQDLANEFIEYLRPMTIVGRLPGLRRVPFNVRMGSMTAGTTGYWVGQGAAIPVSKGTTSSTSLGITKAAGLAVITEELARLSSPSAEALVRDDLANAVRQVVDTQFIDPNQGGQTNISPASVTYNVTPTIASGTAYADLKTDIKALFATWITANVDASGSMWVMSPSIALALSLMQNALGQAEFPSMTIDGGTFFGLPAITSQSTVISGSPDWGNMIVLIKQSDIFLADDGGLSVDASREAAIEMSDGPSSTAAVGTGASLTSMWQTESVALKVVRYINWTKRRSTAVQFIRNAAYV
jgi:HK97 family phage major capsid protein